jgi:hypothetical protein
MRNRSLVLAIASVITSSCGSCSEPDEPATPPPRPTMVETSFALENGLDVDLLSGPCGDEVAVALVVAVGADHDPPGRSGMAHLVSRLPTTGAVEPQRDHTAYSVVVARDRLESALEGAAAWLAPRILSEEVVGRARTAVLADVARRHGGDAAATARSFAAESVRPSRGEGWRGGVAAEVEGIALADVDAFRSAHFTAGNSRLAIVGAFDPAAVRPVVERTFGALPRGEPPALREPGQSTVSGTIVMGDAPSEAAIAVGAPAASEETYPAFLVLAARLGGASAPGDWEAAYDPIGEPDVLYVTGPVRPGEGAEGAAARIREAIGPVLARPLAAADAAAARERFALLLGSRDLDPEACTGDRLRLAIARARRPDLGVEVTPLAAAIDAATQTQVDEARTAFEARRTAAVIGGGAIR